MARSRSHALLALALAVAAAALPAACGGKDDAASQDAGTLLRQTFAADNTIESGRLALTVGVDARGSAQVSGPVTLRLSGPFERTGERTLPRFRLGLRFSGAGQDLRVGATSTGDEGYLALEGRDYEIAAPVFRQFKAGFEDAQSRHGGGLATLGIDPRRWLRNPENAGESSVGGEATIKITGDVDVARMLDDIDGVLRRVRSFGGRGPGPLDDADRRKIQDAVKALDVEIHTGRDDKILRRMLMDLELEAPRRGEQKLEDAEIRVDLAFTDVNEGQDIEAPEDARPFGELARRLGGLGLGGLGRGSAPGGGGLGSRSRGVSPEALERYSACMRAAGADAAKAQRCAGALQP